MFVSPPKALFNRPLPKTKIYAFACQTFPVPVGDVFCPIAP